MDIPETLNDACDMLRQAITSVPNDAVFEVSLTAPYINFHDVNAPMMSFVSKEDVTDLLNRAWVSTPMFHVYIE